MTLHIIVIFKINKGLRMSSVKKNDMETNL